MLVRAFKIKIGRELRLGRVRAAQHRLVRAAGIEPDIERVAVFFIGSGLVAEQLLRVKRLPGFDARALDALRHGFDQFRRARMQLTGFAVHEKRHRHAPLALARQGPVGPIGDHAVQAGLAPARIEGRLLDRTQRRLAQGRAAILGREVHAGEPLRGRAIDDRCLVAPAVHVAVIEHHQLEQRAGFFELGTDRLGGFPDRQAAEERQP